MKILGILNITSDSFSDGGRYLEPGAALFHAQAMAQVGADIIDIGAASSNPDAVPVAPEVQRWALGQGVDYLNDIHGFADAAFYPELARAKAKLIVMHMVQEKGVAVRT